jgi:hypothetical protein
LVLEWIKPRRSSGLYLLSIQYSWWHGTDRYGVSDITYLTHNGEEEENIPRCRNYVQLREKLWPPYPKVREGG